MLEARNLTYVYNAGTTYEKAAVRDVSLSIKKGEFIGIIGHTGSGKSTLIQHFNALLMPTSGSMLIDGEDTSKNKERLATIRRKVGLVFQYPEHQLFELDIYNDVAFGLKNHGCDEGEIKVRVTEALAAVGLTENCFQKSPFELSGGERRRVAIAGVLVLKPSVLVLDEPAAGLDPKGRHEILSQIKRMHTDFNGDLTVVLVSHAMEDIARYSERIYVMQNGSIALSGTPKEIFHASDTLTEIGLNLPQMTQLIRELNDEGLGFDDGIFTVPEAYEAIMERITSTSKRTRMGTGAGSL